MSRTYRWVAAGQPPRTLRHATQNPCEYGDIITTLCRLILRVLTPDGLDDTLPPLCLECETRWNKLPLAKVGP